MFTFHWVELLVVVLCGLALFLGLAFLMLRRRNEMLEKFLTPEEPNLEDEFFRVRKPKQEAPPPVDSVVEPEASETTEEADMESVRWGTPNDRSQTVSH